MVLSILKSHTYGYSMLAALSGTRSFQYTMPNNESTLCARHQASDTALQVQCHPKMRTQNQPSQVSYKLSKVTEGRAESQTRSV